MMEQSLPTRKTRFGEPGLFVLLSLLDGDKHGYAIILDVEASLGVRLGPGTLYGAIAKLQERGLIEAIESTDRRRPYRITAEGRAAARESIGVWNAVGALGSTRLGLA